MSGSDWERWLSDREKAGGAIDLRWCQAVEGEQERHEPEDRVCYFDGEFGSCEQQREQADVACYGEWAESSQVSAVVERDETEGNDDKQDSFFVDVPAEEERGVSA
jgi:hypothetical protein